MSRWEILDRATGRVVVGVEQDGIWLEGDPLNEWGYPDTPFEASNLGRDEVAYNIDTGEVVYR